MAAPIPRQSALAAGGGRLALLALGALVLVVPLVVLPAAQDSFRLPKLLTAEWLGLLSLLFLAVRAAAAQPPAGPDLRRWLSAPVVLAVAPLLAVATLSLATTEHPAHVARALPALWIGAACLVGWASGFDRQALLRCLWLSVAGAALLAAVGALQFHGLFQPFEFDARINKARLSVTSLAGNAGDLGGFLVLPCLLLQERVYHSFRGRARAGWIWAALLLLCGYGLIVAQALTAVLALATGSLVLWILLAKRRRALALAVGVVVAALGVTLSPPLRSRAVEKIRDLARGDADRLLTYRLDAWAAADWMLNEHLLTGVGHGAFAAEFTPAKIALLQRGRPFPDRGTVETSFANAHNDYLEVGAELGVPGLAALALGLFVLVRQARRRGPPSDPEHGALMWAGIAALAVLALASFPFEVALVAYPWVLFLAWVFAAEAPTVVGPTTSRAGQTAKRKRRP